VNRIAGVDAVSSVDGVVDGVNGLASFAAQHLWWLVVVVVAVVVLSAWRTRRALGWVRPTVSAVVTALVIVGVEWLVITSSPQPRTLLAVLAVPALLAGATVGRLVAAAQLGYRIQQGGGRR
jgi:hypothetical protein